MKSTGEAIARYVGKYVSKHIGNRREEDKGVGPMATSKGVNVGTTACAWHSPRSTLWRMRVRDFALFNGGFDMAQLKAKFGPRWAYIHFDTIMRIPIRLYPTAAHARADGINLPFEIPDGATDVWIPLPKRPAFVRRKSKRRSAN